LRCVRLRERIILLVYIGFGRHLRKVEKAIRFVNYDLSYLITITQIG
jgi:hypothetical protein